MSRRKNDNDKLDIPSSVKKREAKKEISKENLKVRVLKSRKVVKKNLKVGVVTPKKKIEEKIEKKEAPASKERGQIISAHVYRTRQLAMWSGVTFFMLLVIIFWFINIRQVLTKIDVENESDINFKEFGEIKSEIGGSIEELKKSLEAIKELNDIEELQKLPEEEISDNLISSSTDIVSSTTDIDIIENDDNIGTSTEKEKSILEKMKELRKKLEELEKIIE